MSASIKSFKVLRIKREQFLNLNNLSYSCGGVEYIQISNFLYTRLLKLKITWKCMDKPYFDVETAAKSLQLCPIPCDPMDCSLPGFSVHGILQARTLEWVAISFSNA